MLQNLFGEAPALVPLLLLVLALGIAFGFEFINGFHDTANAVATVIYTRTLPPNRAVIWSGLWNFLGVNAGGIGVAYSIVNLLPVDLLVTIDSRAGILMVLSILIAATVWNLGTWYLGLPASSSHTLIGSILGVGLANSLITGKGLDGINWTKASEVGLSLLISPLIGFALAAVLLLVARRCLNDSRLHTAPSPDGRPPRWIRGILIGTCTGVSFAHGSNDGQKGMGLIMLILIGLLPAQYALNPALHNGSLGELRSAVRALQNEIGPQALPGPVEAVVVDARMREHLAALAADLEGRHAFSDLPARDRWDVRTRLLHLNRDLGQVLSIGAGRLAQPRLGALGSIRQELRRPIEYVPSWVQMGVALALGIGTTIGWKRIVVTVGEKIGKEHLTYSQGACAEMVAMSTIGLADLGGLPVSTTHVLSSGVAGTMWANRSGLQLDTVRRIGLAWVMTLPAAMILSGGLFFVAQTLEGDAARTPIAATAAVSPAPPELAMGSTP